MGGKKEGKEKNRKEEEKICGKGAKEERGWQMEHEETGRKKGDLWIQGGEIKKEEKTEEEVRQWKRKEKRSKMKKERREEQENE